VGGRLQALVVLVFWGGARNDGDAVFWG